MKSINSCLSLAILFFAIACDQKKAVQTQIPLVTGYKATRQNVPLTLEFPAKITGSLEISVRAQVSGILKSRLFSEGQYVKEGDKLFIIDQEPYQAALTRAQGNLAQAESEMRRANRDYERMRKLFRSGAVSQKEHDDALSAYERAEANVKVAQGTLREAEINLGYTEVKAPISGIVRKEAQSVGNLVSVGGESGLLTTMVQICPLHANFSISGTVWSNLTKGSREGEIKLLNPKDYKVEIILADGSVYHKSGRIIFIDSSEDNLTSSVSIKAEIPNDKDNQILLPGQFVRARIVGAEYQNVIVIPASSLVTSQSGFMVYVVKDDKTVSVRPVKAEIVDEKALIYDGLSEDEIVISEGVIKARPGHPVNAVIKSDTE